jgi:predicted transposase YbfD/YdcC
MPDPRVKRTRRHLLIDILFIALAATIGGADNFVDIERFGRAKESWFRRFLQLPHGIPSHDTFNRVFAKLKPAAFIACMTSWLTSLHQASPGRFIAIDGKTLCGSFDRATGQAALHLVSAWARAQGLVLGQVRTDAHSNEITAIPKLLELLELEGAIVTLDAMGCQKSIAADIEQRGGDYVLAVKENQPTLHAAVVAEFERLSGAAAASLRTHVVTTRATDGTEERRLYCTAPTPPTTAFAGWAGLRSIGMAIRIRDVDGTEQATSRYYISSLNSKVKRFAAAVRGHWEIENSLHWSLDVTFREDAQRTRQGHAAENAAALRRLALSLLKQDKTIKDNVTGKRRRAGWNDEVIERLLCGFQGE